MIGNWSGGGDPLLSTTLSNQTGRRYHMTVERLAPNTWEWLAWREADAMGQIVQRGITSSSDTAMVAAEDAAVTLEVVAAALPAYTFKSNAGVRDEQASRRRTSRR